MSEITIRKASIDDIDQIRAVIDQCGPVLVHHAPYVYWVILHHNENFCAVAEQDGQVIGTCLNLLTGPDRYLLWQVGVLPAYRDKKIARRLVEFIFDSFAAEKATLQFTLDRDNEASIRLFHKIIAERNLNLTKEDEIPYILREYNEDLYSLVF